MIKSSSAQALWYTFRYSLVRQYHSYLLSIASFFFHILALIGIRKMLTKEEQYFDERTCSLSDYSVIVRNIPNVYGSGGIVRNLFREEFGKDSELK